MGLLSERQDFGRGYAVTTQEENLLSSRVTYSILFHTRPWPPFDTEKRGRHVFFMDLCYFAIDSLDLGYNIVAREVKGFNSVRRVRRLQLQLD